jgi:hypothetical protein
LDPVENADDGGCNKEVSGDVVTGLRILDATEVILDGGAAAVEALRILSFLGGIAAVGDVRQNTLILDSLAHLLADVGFVSGNSERRPATYKDANGTPILRSRPRPPRICCCARLPPKAMPQVQLSVFACSALCALAQNKQSESGKQPGYASAPAVAGSAVGEPAAGAT